MDTIEVSTTDFGQALAEIRSGKKDRAFAVYIRHAIASEPTVNSLIRSIPPGTHPRIGERTGSLVNPGLATFFDLIGTTQLSYELKESGARGGSDLWVLTSGQVEDLAGLVRVLQDIGAGVNVGKSKNK